MIKIPTKVEERCSVRKDVLILKSKEVYISLQRLVRINNIFVDFPGGGYIRMKLVFQHEVVVIVYILGCFSLAWHLLHGFQSAFQTFGWNHKRYTPVIKGLGAAFSVIVPLIFALMPLAFYLNWIE